MSFDGALYGRCVTGMTLLVIDDLITDGSKEKRLDNRWIKRKESYVSGHSVAVTAHAYQNMSYVVHTGIIVR